MKPKLRATRTEAALHLFSQTTPLALPAPARQALTEEVARLIVDAALRRSAIHKEANRER